jgi:hypothetical protein
MSNNNPAADDVLVDGKESGTVLEDNLRSPATWTRLLFMLICYVLVSLASIVGSAVVVLGFLWVLFTGKANPELRGVGQSIATYIYENVRYLTFNTEEKPFPLGRGTQRAAASRVTQVLTLPLRVSAVIAPLGVFAST